MKSKRKRKLRKFDPKFQAEVQSNLTRYRWRGSVLPPGEQRDLIRAAQAGDELAKQGIVAAYHRKLIKEANRFHGPSFDERMSAATVGLSRAIAGFDLRSNSGDFSADVRECVLRELRREVRDWVRRGQAGETRADRWLYYHRTIKRPGELSRPPTADDVVAAVGCALADAHLAMERQAGYWHGHIPYDNSEAGFDDDAGSGDCDGDGGRPTYVASRQAPALHSLRGLAVEYAAALVDRRAYERLRLIGRQAYALELVAKDRMRPVSKYPFMSAGMVGMVGTIETMRNQNERVHGARGNLLRLVGGNDTRATYQGRRQDSRANTEAERSSSGAIIFKPAAPIGWRDGIVSLYELFRAVPGTARAHAATLDPEVRADFLARAEMMVDFLAALDGDSSAAASWSDITKHVRAA